MSKEERREQVRFKLIVMPCCKAHICWVNPRLPNYCPECGEQVFTRLRFLDPSSVLVVDDEAWLIIHTKKEN